MKPEVYLDMDGVLADFFAEYAKLAGVTSGNYRDIPPAKTDPTLNKMIGTDFFARLPKFASADQLINIVVKTFGFYHICSSPLRGDYEGSEKYKKIWIQKHLRPQPTDIIITPNKAKYAKQADGTPNILIDDRGSNITAWEAKGGIGIKYQADEDGLDVVINGIKRAFSIIRGEEQHKPQELKSLDRGKMIQVSKSGDSDDEHPTSAADIKEDQSDYEIRNYKKLDNILMALCKTVVDGKKKDPETFGTVAACVLDPDDNAVYGINLPAQNGKRYHAERIAMMMYENEYGEIPSGSIIITTCSPCSEHMDERYDESCTDLINKSNVKKVYCGFIDPTQDEDQREFNLMETQNKSIRDLCETFASTFLDYEAEESALNEKWSQKYKKSINCSNPKGFSQRAHCQGRKKNEGFGDDVASTIVSAGEKARKAVDTAINSIPRPFDEKEVAKDLAKEKSQNKTSENFADGRNPGDKGSLKAKVKGKVTLKKANRLMHKQGATARDKQLAHWFINMQKGKKK
jgi:pyrimidine deaminase RibD-like protein